ncbi:MAG: calcium/sodium antiporter [Bacteroidota bacterium]
MPDLFIWSSIFILTLVTLIVSADFFIKSAERIGLALGIPPFIVGVTLIAMGTSLPELVTSIIAVLSPNADSAIVPGNVLGSNITNSCLVLGFIGVMARHVKMEFDILKVDLPMFLGAAVIMYLTTMDGKFSQFEGIVCLAALGMYLAYIVSLGRTEPDQPPLVDESEAPPRGKISWKEPLILMASGTVIYLSAKYNVDSIRYLASMLRIGKEFIALTAVALGTSLPELVVSIVAVRKNNAEMAIGNILGSNIFNVFAVMGIPRLFGVIEVPGTITEFSLPAMLGATVLCLIAVQDRVVTRWEGWILLLFYGLYIGGLVEGILPT